MVWEQVNKLVLLMQKIDAHQHFWDYDAVKHSWINDSMQRIRKDFLPEDLEPILLQNNIAGCVAVQADETETETNFLLRLAEKNTFIKGVVGWVNFTDKNLPEKLAYFKNFKLIRGFRHVLQNKAPEYMLQPDFINGIAALNPFNFTYDLLIYPTHLEAVKKLINYFPNQMFVIDHLAKPYIKNGLIDKWKKDIKAIAGYDNVFCKISGMVTEADPENWEPQHIKPYLDVVVEAFGTKKIMFGSDWPVCLVAAGYGEILSLTEQYFKSFSTTEKSAIFGNNASLFYQL